MTQPSERSQPGLLQRRIWVFPVWVWLLLLILAVLALIWWRRRQTASSDQGDSSSVLPGGSYGGVISSPNMYTYPTTPTNVVTLPSQMDGTPVPGSEADNLPPSTTPIVTPTPATTQWLNPAYIVKKGDSLAKIAQQYYGNAGRWVDIYNANRDYIIGEAQKRGAPTDGSIIYSGMGLGIPV